MEKQQSVPRVSIIIPAYKQYDKLRSLIDSIIDNSFYENALFELVVVDDGSTSPIRNNFMESKYEVVFFFKYEKNRGAAYARNYGVTHSFGEYIFFLDSDTCILEGTLKNVLSLANENSLVISGEVSPESYLSTGWSDKYRCLVNNVQKRDFHNSKISLFETRVGLIRRDLFYAAGGFNQNLQKNYVEDFEFSRRLIKIAPITFNNRICVYHAFPGFYGNVRNYFLRSKHWFDLYIVNLKFDNYGICTLKNAVSVLLISSPVVALAVNKISFLYFTMALSFLGLLLSYRKIILEGSLKYGLGFGFFAVFYTVLLNLSVVFGVAYSAGMNLVGKNAYKLPPDSLD